MSSAACKWSRRTDQSQHKFPICTCPRGSVGWSRCREYHRRGHDRQSTGHCCTRAGDGNRREPGTRRHCMGPQSRWEPMWEPPSSSCAFRHKLRLCTRRRKCQDRCPSTPSRRQVQCRQSKGQMRSGPAGGNRRSTTSSRRFDTGPAQRTHHPGTGHSQWSCFHRCMPCRRWRSVRGIGRRCRCLQHGTQQWVGTQHHGTRRPW
mmetsp:Transcript_830/g.2432  ORF Transcript_830/g.2432 Transcript_830/m.2432 type:complete len:204 (-) Transcript_830:533-1144(-)